jgi:hypothetical protein
MSFRQPEFRPRNALAEYAQVQQIVGGQRQAEVADMQLEDLRRNRATLNNIRQAIVAKGGPPDLDAAADEMIRSGNPDYMNQGIAIRDALQKQQRLDLYERQFGGAAGASATPTSAAGAITASAPAAAPEGELVAAPITPPMGTMREIAPGGAAGAEMPLTRGANALAPAAAPASTNAMTAAQPAAPAQDVNALMRRYNLASRAGSPDAPVILKQVEAALKGNTLSDRYVPVGNLVFDRVDKVYISPTEAQLAMVRAQQQPAALVPILQNGRPVLVPREQAVGQTPFSPASVQVLGMGPQRESAAAPSQKAPAGYRFTPSGDLEPIPGGPASPSLNPKDIQKREAAFPQATQAVSGFETKSEQFIKELERLRDDPGLNQITGPIFGRTPSVSREGSRAQALYDKIFAKGGFQALQDMREASKTGGALGNVSNEEGRRLEKSIVGGLDRTQNIADVQQGINDLIDEIRTSKSRVRDAYDTTYEYRAQRGAGGGAPAAAKQLSPQDKQALDWANSNPKDPRAAQIKARLGVQ